MSRCVLFTQLAFSVHVTMVPGWYALIHDRGHFLHINNGPEMYGLDYTFTSFEKRPPGSPMEQQYFAVQVLMTNVTYLSDENMLCDPDAQVI